MANAYLEGVYSAVSYPEVFLDAASTKAASSVMALSHAYSAVFDSPEN